MNGCLHHMWLAAGDVYAATLLQSSFWATFHTLLPSIIVAIARSLPRSELCLPHTLCYANMSATLFACRPSNVNHMFTPNASHASFVVRVENQSAIPGVITISFFFPWGYPGILWGRNALMVQFLLVTLLTFCDALFSTQAEDIFLRPEYVLL